MVSRVEGSIFTLKDFFILVGVVFPRGFLQETLSAIKYLDS